MLTIKNAADIEKMKAAGRLTEDVLKLMAEMAKPGVTTEELDKAAEELIRSRGGFPSCLGYNGYPKTICTSVNEQVVHGIPGKYRLKDGDIVSCDVVAKLDGFHGDATRTLLIGDVPEKTRRLVKVTEECFFEGLKFARGRIPHIRHIRRYPKACRVKWLRRGKGYDRTRNRAGNARIPRCTKLRRRQIRQRNTPYPRHDHSYRTHDKHGHVADKANARRLDGSNCRRQTQRAL